MLRKFLVLSLLCGFSLAEPYADEIVPGILRTPDNRFDNLKDFPYKPNYMQIGDYRVHYLDEGPEDADPILLIHGEPTWSYLFRKMIPILTAAGHRVIAPDLIGFGKSDKPVNKADYSYQLQVDVMVELTNRLDLQDATFFGQDWGGLIGLRVVAAEPDRFARVIVSNTGLPAASGIQGWIGYSLFKLAVWWEGAITMEELRANLTFLRWVAYSYHVEDLPLHELMSFMGGDDDVAAAYQAPFPDKRYKAGAQIMPYLVPSQLRVNEEAWKVFEAWDKPFLLAFTDSDPITRGGEQAFLDRVPGATNVTIHGAGHFVQEDAGPELARMMNAFIAGEEVISVTVGKEVVEDSPCTSDADINVYCGFKNAEDLALTPDEKFLVMTGFSALPDTFFSEMMLFDLELQAKVDFRIALSENTWGDPLCSRDTLNFSPHGLSLIQRDDGAYQLAITNHLPSETIEMFELVKNETSWSLEWRGCVAAASNAMFNDVALTRTGNFYATEMYALDLPFDDLLAAGTNQTDTGKVWHWQKGDGYSEVPNSSGSFPNGIALSGNEDYLFINYWFSGKTTKFNLATSAIEFEHVAGKADNLTNINGDIWVASHDITIDQLGECPPELAQCLLPFTIYNLSGDDLTVQAAYSFDSESFGAATVAIPHKGKVWLGTFHGDRIASFELDDR